MENKDWVELYTKLESELPEKGSNTYARKLHELIIKMNGDPRKEDLKLTMVVKYVEHYMAYWEMKHNKGFNPGDIFKIRIPKWIKEIYNG